MKQKIILPKHLFTALGGVIPSMLQNSCPKNWGFLLERLEISPTIFNASELAVHPRNSTKKCQKWSYFEKESPFSIIELSWFIHVKFFFGVGCKFYQPLLTMGFLGWLVAEWQKDCPVDSPCQTLRRWRPCWRWYVEEKGYAYKRNVKCLHACVYIYMIYIYNWYDYLYTITCI